MKRIYLWIITAILFSISGISYLVFELYAPFCAKHTCGVSSGGLWSVIPVITVLSTVLGCFCFVHLLIDRISCKA